MKNFAAENKIFLSLYLLFLLSGGIIICLFEKGDEILYVNSLHNSFFNSFFQWTTRLAEFPALFLILLTVTLSGYGRGLLLSLNALIVFLVIQLFKRALFADEIRPSVFFEGKVNLDYIAGMEIFHYNSFPSGHTAIAFALFFMLSVFAKDKRWGIALFIVALLVGVSRVYLLQHFFRDIYFGSVLGITITTGIYLIAERSKLYNNLSWKDKAILK